MRRHEIKDEDWERIRDLLPGKAGDPGTTAKDNRLFVNAVLWIAKTGAPWRVLPERFGNWNSVWKRFDRWSKKGVWERGVPGPAGSRPGVAPVRQHRGPGAPACGGRKRGQQTQALGRSRGGFSTKIHVSTDGLDNPTRFLLSGGQEADIAYAEPLIEGQRFDARIGDKGYDSDRLVAVIEGQGAEAVIPPKKNRYEPRSYDEHIYKERNKVERFINLMKQFLRVATRYEKMGTDFLGFIYVAAIMVLLPKLDDAVCLAIIDTA